ncbi:Hypothetical membrane protein [Corynebacterium glutamicum ATCC 13032]|uniref:Hypothetical membrane protein n=1 Tax=Corynebacterium glutamicum (strain ATCC 13032 / DSM 20300 / JCM 1318 / BCRC 11384 / CCUG 27702 / LMG 3730 / NBRC 12168 / NCIMB 10025 / NRRL B-2784 / 534) TaxID=196627 RepID=Q8NPP7_CORGL|nr:Hypothetical membrane protein [Corynebacterium glutamicum ATCC 13032]
MSLTSVITISTDITCGWILPRRLSLYDPVRRYSMTVPPPLITPLMSITASPFTLLPVKIMDLLCLMTRATRCLIGMIILFLPQVSSVLALSLIFSITILLASLV